ncbi:MAG: hypothetical protein HND53_05160 [Proteobacteria bacterium]|nr:hypothetical protein [Pseudomonadota bacterium]NOG59870.1 hypothetical protein [Pseudomonadota bacterium]
MKRTTILMSILFLLVAWWIYDSNFKKIDPVREYRELYNEAYRTYRSQREISNIENQKDNSIKYVKGEEYSDEFHLYFKDKYKDKIKNLQISESDTKYTEYPKYTDISVARGIAKKYPRPISEWRIKEKELYQSLLLNGDYDLVIVPFQVDKYAFDRATRSLMTSKLVYEITRDSNLKVPDPYLVYRALGEGKRQFSMKEVIQFAEKLGVKKVVYGYVGHDRQYKMDLTIMSLNIGLDSISDPEVKSFNGISFTDEKPPIDVYDSLLLDILQFLKIDSSSLTSKNFEQSIEIAGLPEDPVDLFLSTSNPVNDAYILQLFAYLTPAKEERTKERFAEKSFIALSEISPNTEKYKALKARAYMLMGLRIAALEVIGEPETIEEKALFHILNGNLPDAESLSEQMDSGIAQLLTNIDINNIAARYGVVDKNNSIEKAKTVKLPGQIWPYLVERAFTDWDSWSNFKNIYLKVLLDQAVPLSNFTAKGIMGGSSALGEMSELKSITDLSIVNHIKKLYEAEPLTWCCLYQESLFNKQDYINLIESMANDNLMRHANFLNKVQGRPKSAISFLDKIESAYNGYPAFSLERALALKHYAKKIKGVDKESTLKSAYLDNYNAMYWAQGQSLVSEKAFQTMFNMRRNDFGRNDNLYAGEYPHKPYYTTLEQDGQNYQIMKSNDEAAARNSVSHIGPLLLLLPYKNTPADSSLEFLEGRFNGHPQKSLFLANKSYAKGKFKEAEKYYREGIKYSPTYLDTYTFLGNMLFANGEIEESFQVFMSYPGFKENYKGNRVALDNYSHAAGSLFFWSGHFENARALYEISSNLNTGSESGLASNIRINLLDKNIEIAMIESLRRAKRYNSYPAYRDYLGMLHAIGNSEEAWDAFDLLVNRKNEPHIWESALVGHHQSGLSESEIALWANQYKQSISEYGVSLSANYLLRAGVTDRVPTKDLSSLIADVDRSVKTEIKSDLVYFSDAYSELLVDNYESASNLFHEASQLYDMRTVKFGYMLPYYAFSSVKSGNISEIENLIDSFFRPDKLFDLYLAKAILSGLNNETNNSVQYLKKALYNHPTYTEFRPLMTEYQYAEICEMLYEETNNDEYKKILLDWVKKVQQIQPWFSWAYAMEAKYSNNVIERNKAIAMTYYLDRNSERLKSIPKDHIDTAVKKHSKDNLFKKKVNPVEPRNASFLNNARLDIAS